MRQRQAIFVTAASFALLLGITFCSVPGFAQGWHWFLKHRPPLGKCVGREWIISSYCDGTRTASGERLNCRARTAAHNTLPFGTRVHITNPRNGRSVVVRINDRGPLIAGRARRDAIDLTTGAFRVLGALGPGGRHESGWGCVSY